MENDLNKRGYVDALRGVAVLMVVFVHTAQAVQIHSESMQRIAEYCQTGVQLFFVLSAYTLCLSFEKRSNEPLPIASFYIRRLFRIAPLYYLAIPIYFAFHAVRQVYGNGHPLSMEPYSFGNIAANVVFIHGFVPSANNVIVPGGWSIGTEMAFYLVFPLIFAASKKIGQDAPLRLLPLLAISIGADIAIQMAISELTGNSVENNGFMYFSIVNQLPVFVVGIFAYFAHARERWLEVMRSRSLSIFGFFFLSALALLLWELQLKLSFVLIPTVSALSFLFLLNWFKGQDTQSETLVRIGRVSYSMYIFHFLFAQGVLRAIAKRTPDLFASDAMLVVAFAVISALTFLVAQLTEKAIEAKGIALGGQLIRLLKSAPQWSLGRVR